MAILNETSMSIDAPVSSTSADGRGLPCPQGSAL